MGTPNAGRNPPTQAAGDVWRESSGNAHRQPRPGSGRKDGWQAGKKPGHWILWMRWPEARSPWLRLVAAFHGKAQAWSPLLPCEMKSPAVLVSIIGLSASTAPNSVSKI